MGRRAGLSQEDAEDVFQVVFTTLLPAARWALVVAAVTVANGGDHIGIYVPLFASAGAGSIAVMVAVFAVKVAVRCSVAFWPVHHSSAGPRIQRYGHIVCRSSSSSRSACTS